MKPWSATRFRAGELLKDLEKAVGGRPSEKTPAAKEGVSKAPLKDLGISHKQSSNWQRLAAVPQAIFDDELKHSPRPTTSGLPGRSNRSAGPLQLL